MSHPASVSRRVSGAEFRGEGGRPGADRRARPRSVRRGGQDEARAQWPDHGREGNESGNTYAFLHVLDVSLRCHEPFLCVVVPSADSGHSEHSGAEEAAHGPGHLHEDGGLFLHGHLLRSAVQRGNASQRCSTPTRLHKLIRA